MCIRDSASTMRYHADLQWVRMAFRDFSRTVVVNLIYIDPPFNTGQDFSFSTTLPESDALFTKTPSIIETTAYRDTWGAGRDSYLQWFYETATLLHELLADEGSMFVHLDVHMGPYVKVVLDEIFGEDNFLNQIAWY